MNDRQFKRIACIKFGTAPLSSGIKKMSGKGAALLATQMIQIPNQVNISDFFNFLWPHWRF